MNKLVNWGHWAVAAFLAIQGILTLWNIALVFPPAWRRPDTLTPSTGYIMVGLCALLFACAWSIVKWRKWAHTCTFGLLLLDSADFVLQLATIGWAANSARFAFESAVPSLAACVWRVLPTVRTTLAQRQQMA
jgi:hypothetical protein